MSARAIGILVGLIVAFSMIWLNCSKGTDTDIDDRLVAYHGWPIRWSIEAPYPPLASLAFGVALSVGAAIGTTNLVLRLGVRVHISLRGLFAMTGALAIAFVLIWSISEQRVQEAWGDWVNSTPLYDGLIKSHVYDYVDGITTSITLFALFPACMAVMDLVGWLWPGNHNKDS